MVSPSIVTVMPTSAVPVSALSGATAASPVSVPGAGTVVSSNSSAKRILSLYSNSFYNTSGDVPVVGTQGEPVNRAKGLPADGHKRESPVRKRRESSVSSFRSDLGVGGCRSAGESRKVSLTSFKSDLEPFSPSHDFSSDTPLIVGAPTPLIVGAPTPYMSEVAEIALPLAHQYAMGHANPGGATFPLFPSTPAFLPAVGHLTPGMGSPAASMPQPSSTVPLTDLSKMSRWEIEQLYYYNAAILEEQKQLMRLIEYHLALAEHEGPKKDSKKSGFRRPTTIEVYRKFLNFLVEPDTEPSAGPNMFGFKDEPEIEDLIVEGTPYQPIMSAMHTNTF